MRTRPGFVLCLIVIFVFMGEFVHAATTLYLPRQFEPAEMGGIGLAFVNPTTTAAALTFRLRTAQGVVTSTVQRTIPQKGQLALTLNQVFPDAASAGWLSAESDVDQVTGFWMGGDFVNSTDGAAFLTSSQAISSPVFTFFSRTSEISFVNLGTSTLTGNLLLFNAAGSNLVSLPFSLPSLGLFQQTVASLFPAQADSFDTSGYWINVSSSTSAGRVIGTAITPRAGGDNIVTNIAYESSNLFLFPQVVDGAIGGTTYSTLLTLTNFQTTAQTATMTLRQTSGAVLTATRPIPARGVLRETLASLFNVSSLDGWLLVGTGGGNIGGFVTYTDLVNGGSSAVAMQRQAADTALIFGHIADLSPWLTGIALVNYFTTSSNVEVYAIDAAGNLIGGPSQNESARFTLAPQSKKAFLLSDVVPRTQQRSLDGGYIYIRSTNNVGLYGTELFFSRNGRIISSVPGAGLGTLTFTVPTTLSQNVVQVSLAPASATVQAGATQQFAAAVTGSANTSVTWSVNDIAGGNGTVGTISASGLYTAPAAVPASNTVTIKATSVADPTKSAAATVSITPQVISSTARTLTITSSAPPAAPVGSNYLFAFSAAGGTPPYVWSGGIRGGSDALTNKNGMTLSEAGILSGKPTYSGRIPLYVQVKDAQNRGTALLYDFQFTGAGSPASITNAPPAGTEGTPYSFKFAGSWVPAPQTGFCSAITVNQLAGPLPPGISLDFSSGILSGTPTTAGMYTFTVYADMGFGINCTPDVTRANAQTFTLQINPKSPTAAPRGSSNWVRASSAPVLTPTSGAWDSYIVTSPSVIKVGATYMMYYEGEDLETHTRQIGLATSPDGLSWTKSLANPVLGLGSSGSWDDLELRYPTVHFDGTTYRMWYSAKDLKTKCNRMGLATSSDGATWTKSASNPINLDDNYNCAFGYDYAPGTVIQNGGTFRMWYWVPFNNTVIRTATSSDGIKWTVGETSQSTSNQVKPSVVLDGSTYRMWFNRYMGSAGSSVGYGTSADGLGWTVSGGTSNRYTVFGQGPDNAWDRPGVGQPSVMLDGSTFKMWYAGGQVNQLAPVTEGGTGDLFSAVPIVEGSIGYATSTP